MKDVIGSVIDGAYRHGELVEDTDCETSDLREALRLAFDLMTVNLQEEFVKCGEVLRILRWGDNSNADFKPDWVSPPGDTIKDLLEEKKIAMVDFANKMHFSTDFAQLLLDGKVEVTPDIATWLSEVVGGTESFWINREVDYRKDLARLARIGK